MKHPGFYASPEMDFDDFLREPFPRLLVISVTLALAGLTFWAFATYLQARRVCSVQGFTWGFTLKP